MEKIYTEKDLLLPALEEIAKSGPNGLTTTQLIKKLEKKLKPTGKDLEKSPSRNDSTFSQKVRNLISHKTITEYVLIDSIEGINKQMFINDKGISYLNNNNIFIDIDDEYSANIENVDDFRDENDGYRINKTIELDNLYMSVSDLKRKYDRNKKGNDLNALKLDIPFQRNENIWSAKNKSLFIESVILNIPIPSIYLSEDNKGSLIVIDGRQRLSTLFQFMDDSFKLRGLSLLSELNGKKFSQLTGDLEKYKLKIEDRMLHIAKIRYGTEATWIIETFERVNTKGARLNAQEIRNAIYQGKSTQLLNEISALYTGENEIIDTIRMKDKYLILRFFAMLHFYKDMDKDDFKFISITDFLAKTMERINKYSDDEILELKQIFINCYDRALLIWGKERAFRIKEGSPINMIMFEITLLFVHLMNNKEDKAIKDAVCKIINIDIEKMAKEDRETPFEKNIKYHRDACDNIKQRLKWVGRISEE